MLATANPDSRQDPAVVQAAAWRVYHAAPDDPAARAHLVAWLKRAPQAIDPAREADLRALLDDRRINPQALVGAGWALLDQARRMPAAPPDAAAWLERDELARE